MKRLVINAILTYVAVYIAWCVYTVSFGIKLDPESVVSFASLDAIIITLLMLVSIYLLSFLDKSVLNSAFVIMAAAAGVFLTYPIGSIIFAPPAAAMCVYVLKRLYHKVIQR